MPESVILEFTPGKRDPRSEYANVRLRRCGRKWWLHYSKERETGPFKTRREALFWYDTGGR